MIVVLDMLVNLFAFSLTLCVFPCTQGCYRRILKDLFEVLFGYMLFWVEVGMGIPSQICSRTAVLD